MSARQLWATVAALSETSAEAAAAWAEPGADEEIVSLAEDVIATYGKADRLDVESDDLDDPRRQAAFRREEVEPLLERSMTLRAKLVTMPATTLEGFRAKARVVRFFSECRDGHASGLEDEAVAWSLANDLLSLLTQLEGGSSS